MTHLGEQVGAKNAELLRLRTKTKGGFRKFRVPTRAKAYVHKHLDIQENHDGSTKDGMRK